MIDFIDNYIFVGEYVLLAEDGGDYSKFGTSAYIMSGKFWVNNHAHVLKAIEGNLNNWFLMYILNYLDLRPYVVGSTRTKINQDHMKNIPIPLPPLPEQRRIAEVLRTVDEALERVDREMEHTERLKRGLMQHLLTRGIGHTRFKDSPLGKIPETWEVVRLGDVFKIYAGGDVSKISISSERSSDFPYPVFSNTVENEGLYGFSRSYQFPENSITITARGTIGVAIPRWEKFCAVIRLIVLVPDHEVDIVFASNYINSIRSMVIEKTSIPQLTIPRVSKWKIPLPPLPEQRKIAEILMTVDRKLELLRQEKEHLQRLKKGLMDDLLTGRRRLRVEGYTPDGVRVK